MKHILLIILLSVSIQCSAKHTEIECLAQNIYHEARGEPPLGKLLVAKVTINRVNSGKFRNTICGVVYQPHQFSWTIGKHKPIKDKKAWQESLELAELLLTSGILDYLPNNILYFHAWHVQPAWPFKKLVQIGNHIFYV